MEYGRIKPLEGTNGYVPTAFTKKSIKEMLEEEARALAEAGEAEKAAQAQALSAQTAQPEKVSQGDLDEPDAPKALEASWLQQPPHMRAAAPQNVDVIARLKEREETTAKPRSFFRRLIGG
ncbi:MAG: hypothetical protein ACRBCL_05475 [Maritimibacter sp.]